MYVPGSSKAKTLVIVVHSKKCSHGWVGGEAERHKVPLIRNFKAVEGMVMRLGVYNYVVVNFFLR